MIDKNQNVRNEWWLSIPAIIVAYVLFWPVGIYLTWKRVSTNKKSVMGSGKALRISGGILIGLGVLGILAFFSEPETFLLEDTAIMLTFGISGYILRRMGLKVAKRSSKYKRYITIIVNQNITDLRMVSNIADIPADEVKKDIADMIDKGFFPHSYINHQAYEIVMPSMQNQHQAGNIHKQMQVQATPSKIIECQGCGAKNVVAEGGIMECEYCGSSLA